MTFNSVYSLPGYITKKPATDFVYMLLLSITRWLFKD